MKFSRGVDGVARFAAMRFVCRGFAAALLAFAGLQELPAASRTPQTLSTTEQAELQRSLDRGTLLYEYDQSAWHVTDAALAAVPDSSKQMIRGYVTTQAPDGFRTTFFGEGGASYRMLYSAIWTGSAIEGVEQPVAGEQTPLSAQELRLVQARKLALASATKLKMCSNASPNVIVVPDKADATIHVYIMTPQTKNGVYPLGGHYRLDVLNGSVVGERSFTKSCIDIDTGAVAESGRPEAGFVTHLFDPVPTEIHVFTVLAMRLPLFVGVKDGRVYGVEVSGGVPRVRLVPNQ